MKILVTGFDPFGGEMINPAIEAVKRLPDEVLGHSIIKLEIKTVYRKSLNQIREAILKHQPDVILSVGQAGGKAEMAVEKVGINLDDFRIKDNEGNQPINQPIYKDGPTAYFSNLPVKAMVYEIRRQGIPASVSYTAGTFVCNHVLYGVQYLIDHEFKGLKSGFIHIPFLPQQVVGKSTVPSMDLSMIVKGLESAILAIVTYPTDIELVTGKTH